MKITSVVPILLGFATILVSGPRPSEAISYIRIAKSVR
jgi:hypothetical protein